MLVWTAARTDGHERDSFVAELRGHGPDAVRATQRQLISGIGRTWGLGYGPAELLHLLGRALGATQAAVTRDAIVREHARSGAGRATAWCRQVDQVAGEGPSTPVRMTTIAQGVEVLAVLFRLAGVPADTSLVKSAEDSGLAGAVLARVRALLRKAESTEFDAEAEALTAKAHQLITRHAVDEALLAGVDEPVRTGVRRILLDDPYLDAKASLVARVAEASRCSAVYSKSGGWSTVFGHVADLDAVQMLVASLQAQALHAMVRHGPMRDAHGRSRTRSFRSSFLSGFATRIGERLEQASAQVVAEDDRALPVLASRLDAATDAAQMAFPDSVQKTLGGVANGAGWVAGKTAADLASLNLTSGVLVPRPS